MVDCMPALLTFEKPLTPFLAISCGCVWIFLVWGHQLILIAPWVSNKAALCHLHCLVYIDQLEHHLQSHDQDAPKLLDTKVPILLYADDVVLLSQSPSGLQKRLNVLQLFCAEKLLTVNMSRTQVAIFNNFRHSHSDSFLYSHQQLQIVEQYTYLGIVLHKGGFYKRAISKLTSAGKRALFAMQHRCSDLGIDDIKPRCSLFSSLVQPLLSYGCEIWGLEHPDSWRQILSIHHIFMKRTLHVCRSTPSDIVLCELGQVPLHLFCYKMLLQYVGRLVDLPDDRLVKQAFTHAQQQKTFRSCLAGYLITSFRV